jgi:ribonuclease P/MRP protein subunit POP1
MGMQFYFTIPVILIQRPGVRQGTRINYGCGWDIILPPNWSMAFWLACIYRGARAAGVRELQSLALY